MFLTVFLSWKRWCKESWMWPVERFTCWCLHVAVRGNSLGKFPIPRSPATLLTERVYISQFHSSFPLSGGSDLIWHKNPFGQTEQLISFIHQGQDYPFCVPSVFYVYVLCLFIQVFVRFYIYFWGGGGWGGRLFAHVARKCDKQKNIYFINLNCENGTIAQKNKDVIFWGESCRRK